MSRIQPWLGFALTLLLCSCKSMSPVSTTPSSASAPAESAPTARRADYLESEPSRGAVQRATNETSTPHGSAVRQIAHQEPAGLPKGQSLAPIVPAPGATSPSAAPAPGSLSPIAPGPAVPQPGVPAWSSEPPVIPAGPEYTWQPACSCNCGPSHGAQSSCGPVYGSAGACGPGYCGPNGPGRPPFRPTDEYLCDGGDTHGKAIVRYDWSVLGIDPTDTIAHYDTLNGRTEVEASNRVCIYSPRFGAVRRVTAAFQEEAMKAASDVAQPVGSVSDDRTAGPNAVLHPLQLGRNTGLRAPNALLEQDGGLLAENVISPHGAANPLQPFENFEIIRRGIYLNSDKVRLHERAVAALAWMNREQVDILIDGVKAEAVETAQAAQATVHYELQGKGRLRVCKVASTAAAKPGDLVEFTLRFDNVGDQKIGNVTLIDSLTTRLEYVEDSQQSSVGADFFATDNEADSLILRWELTEPLEVGEGGIIRFQCRVR